MKLYPEQYLYLLEIKFEIKHLTEFEAKLEIKHLIKFEAKLKTGLKIKLEIKFKTKLEIKKDLIGIFFCIIVPDIDETARIAMRMRYHALLRQYIFIRF